MTSTHRPTLKAGMGISHERKSRHIADRLLASATAQGVRSYSSLVSAARSCLAEGMPPRDSTVIARAKRSEQELREIIDRHRARNGQPPMSDAEWEAQAA